MKKNLIIILAIIEFMFFNSFNCNIEQLYSDEEQIIKLLKYFYTEYISECDNPSTNWSQIEIIKEKYCTRSLIKKIKVLQEDAILDYDPFLNAQDCDINWLKTLNITKENNDSCWYDVSYMDNYNSKRIIIKLNVIKDENSYKINDIWSLNNAK
jgi:hypothetical protein